MSDMNDKTMVIRHSTVPVQESSAHADAMLIELGLGVIKEIADVYKTGIQCFTEYQKCKQRENTERMRIQKYVEVITTKLAYEKELKLKLLDDDSKEKKFLYDTAALAMQHALLKDDFEVVKYIMDYMLIVYKTDKTTVLNAAEALNSFKFPLK